MPRTRGRALLLTVALLAACGRPPDDAELVLRQRSLGRTLEVTVDDARLVIVVTERTKVLERAAVPIAPKDAAKIRDLFWEAFRHQPAGRLTAVRDLVFEQEWRSRSRAQRVLIQGYPLTAEERRAYPFVNRLLPPQYRFAVDAGPYRRTTPD